VRSLKVEVAVCQWDATTTEKFAGRVSGARIGLESRESANVLTMPDRSLERALGELLVQTKIPSKAQHLVTNEQLGW